MLLRLIVVVMLPFFRPTVDAGGQPTLLVDPVAYAKHGEIYVKREDVARRQHVFGREETSTV